MSVFQVSSSFTQEKKSPKLELLQWMKSVEAQSAPCLVQYSPPNQAQLAEACFVVSILDPKVKKDLLNWFVRLQLSEYMVLFAEEQDVSCRACWPQNGVHVGYRKHWVLIFWLLPRWHGWTRLTAGMPGSSATWWTLRTSLVACFHHPGRSARGFVWISVTSPGEGITTAPQ